MKLRKTILALGLSACLFSGVTFALSACDVNADVSIQTPAPEVRVQIEAHNQTIFVGDDFDWKSLFSITAGGEYIFVTDAMLTGEVNTSEAGEYTVTLNYTSSDGKTHTQSAKVTVKIAPVDVEITVSNQTVTEGTVVDKKSLFALTANGERVEITDEMISGEVNFNEVGEYVITLNYTAADGKTHTQTAKITVTAAPIEVELSYASTSVMEGTAVYCKSLFSIKVNGETVTVTDAMLDLGNLNPSDPEPGEYAVVLTYVAQDGVTYTATSMVYVKEIPPVEVLISAKNQTVTQGDSIDCKSLFTVTADGETVEITDDMISGEVNFNEVGEYTVTLTYTSSDEVIHTQTAKITVKIAPVTVSITVSNKTVEQGDSLDYKSLFTVTANGETVEITDEMISGEVNLDEVGEYTVTLNYTAADGVTYTQTATVTVEKRFVQVSISRVNKTVEQSTFIDLKSLFMITADGEKVLVTDEMISGEVNFDEIGQYTVTLNYTSTDGETHTATASVTVIAPKVVITATSLTVDEEANIDYKRLRGLFVITENGENVTVTDAMLNLGGLTPSYALPGKYIITLTYVSKEGVTYTATATVTVIQRWFGPY